MDIELLYFDGCASWERGLENLKAALAAENILNDIHVTRVESDQDAVKEKFPGSPTFRINGQDLWPDESHSYQLACRIYATENGMRGVPSVEMLRSKIKYLKDEPFLT